jgi:drug/metabolite transporter (DMT)-like permease
MKDASSRGGAALVAAAAITWGLWPMWVRWGASGTGVLAFAVTGVVGLPFALLEARGRDRRPMIAWALMGLMGLVDAGNLYTYFRALSEGAIAPGVLSHYLCPVMVALAAPVFLGEARGRRTPGALVLALAGTALLVFSGEPGPAGAGAVTRALLFGCASAACYAALVLMLRGMMKWFGNFELLVYHSLVSAALLWLVVPVSGSAKELAVSIGGGLLNVLIASTVYNVGLRRIPAERAAIIAYLEPASAVLVGWLALGEHPSALALAGGALVLAGGALVATDSTRAT